jgi:sulfite exporter TauE/SafE
MIPMLFPDLYFSSLVLGLLYGLTFCNTACLPYLISYIAGIGAGFRKGVAVASVYNSGRILAYTVLGGVTAALGIVVSEAFFVPYQVPFSIVFGFVIILVGIDIVRKKTHRENCRLEKRSGTSYTWRGFDLRALSMGFTRGLMVCPPLVALLLASLALPNTNSIIVAILFGLGTALSPLAVAAGATGWLLNKAPMFSGWLSKIGGAILLFMGSSVLLSTLLSTL